MGVSEEAWDKIVFVRSVTDGMRAWNLIYFLSQTIAWSLLYHPVFCYCVLRIMDYQNELDQYWGFTIRPIKSIMPKFYAKGVEYSSFFLNDSEIRKCKYYCFTILFFLLHLSTYPYPWKLCVLWIKFYQFWGETEWYKSYTTQLGLKKMTFKSYKCENQMNDIIWCQFEIE